MSLQLPTHSNAKLPLHRQRFARRLLASAAALSCAPAFAQTEAPSVENTLQQVVVTGTRRVDRTLGESESPVDVISARELQRTGATELATALAQLLPSLNFPRPSLTDASDAVRPAQLRGLSPDQTLVLIDGKRRHSGSVVNINGTQGRGSAPVDLNAIPVSAIDHIEVLRDGAAAQYGSDAIAGVINIVLKKGGKGGSLDAGVSQTDAGDGTTFSGGVSLGTLLGSSGWARLAVETRHQQRTNRAGVDTRDAATEPRKGQINNRLGDPDSSQNALVLNGQIELWQGVQAYAFGTLSRRESTSAAFWRTKATAAANGVGSIYPEGFLPLEESRTTDTGLVLGLRGQLHGWQWDASINHGGNRFDIGVDNTANYSLGAASPRRFDAGGLRNRETLANIDVSRELNAGLAGPLTLSLGAELREERYEVVAGEPASYQSGGASGFPGFQPSNAGEHKRHNTSVYAGLEGQLTAAFSASAALRAEHYSDFGSATAAKLSGRYVISSALSLRGTASTGFRAPSLAQQYFATTSTNLINGQLVDAGTFPVSSPAAIALGATPLRAEKSRNFSAGVLLQATKDWQTTLDLYQIDIDHRILLSGNLSLPAALRTTLANQGVYVSAGRYFTNALDTRTRGADLVSTLRQGWGSAGSSDFTLAYNYNRNTVRGVDSNPDVLTANNLTLIDRVSLGRATVSSPQSKLVLAAEHQLGPWNGRVAATRYGSYVVRQSDATLDQNFNPAWLLDASLGWSNRNWTVSAGIDNLTNRYPDHVLAANSVGGILQYSSFSPFGFNGRTYYGRLSYHW
ncbi:TonB-dependent receptor plug domain-containing protein [Burkholderiaceae bacterium UC74_6]